MSVVFSGRSRTDLAEILEFHILRDPRYARRLTDELVAAAESVAEFPDRGAVIGRTGSQRTRRRILESGHAIVYEHVGDDVIVVRILHGARDIDAILSEDS